MKRILTLILTMGLLGLTPVALVASPAEAASCKSRVVQYSDFNKRYVHGQRIYYNFTVQANCSGTWGNFYGKRTLLVQRKKRGQSKWRTVATNPHRTWVVDSGRWKGNAQYRAVYRGETHNGRRIPSATWRTGKNTPRTWVRGVRQMNVKDPWSNRKADVKVRVKPYKRGVVKLQRKRGGNWRTIRKDRTNRKGVAKFRRLPAPAKLRVVAKKNKRYLKTGVKFRTHRR